jgi:glycosyltransferase involved in cell wall biosynthesis
MPNASRAFGGPTESLIGYARAAQTQGVDVQVAAPSISEKDEAWLREQLPHVRFHFFTSAGRHAWVVAPGLWTWLWSHGEEYDVVHVHGLFNPVSSLSAQIAVRRGYPTVMRPFGTLSRYTFSRRSALKRLYFQLLDRPSLQRASGIHFTTEAERDEANRLDLSLDERSHIVPPPWRGDTAPADLDAKAEQPTVLFMSRLHPKKNVAGLLDAWAEVVETLPEARLWIAGDGDEDYVSKRRQQVERLGLQDRVSFLGFVQGEEKERVLREAWAFALPSHQENFGVAVLEAVAAGLPVVISGEVQLRAFIDANDLGVVVDRTDSSEIADGLTHILRSPSVRERCARVGPEAVDATFSENRVGEQLAQMYEAVTSHSAPARS